MDLTKLYDAEVPTDFSDISVFCERVDLFNKLVNSDVNKSENERN